MSSLAMPLPLEPGDKIKLNSRAPKWTRGKTFTVDEVKGWGVVCFTKPNPHKAYYLRASWDEIEEPC